MSLFYQKIIDACNFIYINQKRLYLILGKNNRATTYYRTLLKTCLITSNISNGYYK